MNLTAEMTWWAKGLAVQVWGVEPWWVTCSPREVACVCNLTLLRQEESWRKADPWSTLVGWPLRHRSKDQRDPVPKWKGELTPSDLHKHTEARVCPCSHTQFHTHSTWTRWHTEIPSQLVIMVVLKKTNVNKCWWGGREGKAYILVMGVEPGQPLSVWKFLKTN